MSVYAWIPKVLLTPVDAEIWDFWVAYKKPAWRSALMSNSFPADANDAAIMLDLMRTKTSLLGKVLITQRTRRALLAYQGGGTAL
jgi:hypothetical protein